MIQALTMAHIPSPKRISGVKMATTAKNDRILHVVYGVTLFILSGYAHSIALAGYAAIARGIAWWVIPAAAAGNAAGSYGIRWLLTASGGKK